MTEREAEQTEVPRPARRTKTRRRILIGVAVFFAAVLVLAAAFVTWALTPLGPSADALDALRGSSEVTVTAETGAWVFRPSTDEARVGLVFYPGGRVDPRSYAPLARDLAANGYFVAIVPMRLNLAVLSPDRASEIISGHPEIVYWAVGGHSLGGVMAARYAAEHRDTVQALALLAAYSQKSSDLAKSDMIVVSAYGSRDGVLDARSFTTAMSYLPANTTYVRIEGGNHAGFGSYGKQPGDNAATITEADQRMRTVDAIATALRPLRLKTR